MISSSVWERTCGSEGSFRDVGTELFAAEFRDDVVEILLGTKSFALQLHQPPTLKVVACPLGRF